MKKKAIMILSALLVLLLLALYLGAVSSADINGAGVNGTRIGTSRGSDAVFAKEIGGIVESFQKIQFMIIAIIASTALYFLVLFTALFLLVRKRHNKMKKSVPVVQQTTNPVYGDTGPDKRLDLSTAIKVDGTFIGATSNDQIAAGDFIAQKCDKPEITEEPATPQDGLPNEVNEVLAYIEADPIVENNPEYELDAVTGNLFAEALRHVTGADISFLNSGGIRSPLNHDNITEDDISRAFPFDDTVMVQGLNGKQIKAVLEYCADMLSETGGRHLQASGITAELDATMPTGERVVSVTLPDGTPLNGELEYIVAANDYLANGGDGYDMLAALPKMSEGQTVVQAVSEYVTDVGIKGVSESENIKIRTIY